MAERVYIDAELAKDAICECYITDDEKLMLIRRINRVPAADVVEVRHGEWIIHNSLVNGVLLDENEVFVCSACQEQRTHRKYNYCPHCGAKMDGGQDDA